MTKQLSIVILYDPQSTHIKTVFEHLYSFRKFSQHNVVYAAATYNVDAIDLNAFDVVIIHYNIRLCLDWHLSKHYQKALKNYKGCKVVFIQDEYDNTNTAKKWMKAFDINLLFTCVPKAYWDDVYPKRDLPNTTLFQTLTGYVPLDLKDFARFAKPYQERDYLIGYRGRALPFQYGNLGHEKFIIAKQMKDICAKRGLNTNIEFDEKYRIYGDAWYEFLGNCRATLGTESGSNVFDFTGSITKKIRKILEVDPTLTYETIHQKFLKNIDGKIKMNQISPRIFESIATKTALILFEGDYSHVIAPHVHYIPLKKDFSNVNDVLEALKNDEAINKMLARAEHDIIDSGKYSYQTFIRDFDKILTQEFNSNDSLSSFIDQHGKAHLPTLIPHQYTEFAALLATNLTATQSLKCKVNFYLKKMWDRLPPHLRKKLSLPKQIYSWLIS